MLVLTRKEMQRIVATTKSGEKITFTFLRIKGDSAKIGVDAPPSVHILRGELVESSEDQQHPPNSAAA